MFFGSAAPAGAALAGLVSMVIFCFYDNVPAGAWVAAGGLTFMMIAFIAWYEWTVRRQRSGDNA